MSARWAHTLPLETKRLIIRPFELDDAESYFCIDGDPEVMARIPVIMPYGVGWKRSG